MDPIAGSSSDDDLWKALEIAQLKEMVQSLDLGLGKFAAYLLYGSLEKT